MLSPKKRPSCATEPVYQAQTVPRESKQWWMRGSPPHAKVRPVPELPEAEFGRKVAAQVGEGQRIVQVRCQASQYRRRKRRRPNL